jgi:hypothetical protein
MAKLKPNQISEKKAMEWLSKFDKMKKQIKLNFRTFFIERQTWEILSGSGNLQRIRVYFGLETGQPGARSLCAYAISTTHDDQGIYRDQPGRIFKLDPANVDCTGQLEEVVRHIKAWNDWRAGKAETKQSKANNNFQLFPAAFLLHASNLSELFSHQGLAKVKLEFGMEERINLLAFNDETMENMNTSAEYFDFQEPCPPVCDLSSPFIT